MCTKGSERRWCSSFWNTGPVTVSRSKKRKREEEEEEIFQGRAGSFKDGITAAGGWEEEEAAANKTIIMPQIAQVGKLKRNIYRRILAYTCSVS